MIFDINLEGGMGFAAGDPMVFESVMTDGNILYVDSVNGDDANIGSLKQPFKTLQTAVTASSANDTIVLFPDFDETLVNDIVLSDDGVTLVGAGTSGGQPTATLRINDANDNILDITGGHIEVRNIRFATAVQANGVPKVMIGGSEADAQRTLIKGCLFESGPLDVGNQLRAADTALGLRVEDCTFRSVSLATEAPPGIAILVNGTLPDNMLFRNVVIDGGVKGWVGGSGYVGTAVGQAQLRFENVTLLNGSTATFLAGATLSNGRLNINARTGGQVIFQ